MAELEIETRDAVKLVRINRPHRLNALDPDTSIKCRDFFTAAAADDKVRAVIVTGTGSRAFCAGFDLKAAATGAYRDKRVSIGGITKDVAFFKPVIAAINGLAYGGGLELTLACDLRLAVPSATFATPEVKLGVIPGGGGTVRLQDNLPRAVAAEMLLRGRVLSSEEALRFGLVNLVVSPDDLLPKAWQWAAEMAEFPPKALRSAKEVMWRSRGVDMVSALSLEERYSRVLQTSDEARQAAADFSSHRKRDSPP